MREELDYPVWVPRRAKEIRAETGMGLNEAARAARREFWLACADRACSTNDLRNAVTGFMKDFAEGKL